MAHVRIVRKKLIFYGESYHRERTVIPKIHIIKMPHAHAENFRNAADSLHYVGIAGNGTHIVQHVIVLHRVYVQAKSNDSGYHSKPDVWFEYRQGSLLVLLLLWFYVFFRLHKNRTVNIIFKSESQKIIFRKVVLPFRYILLIFLYPPSIRMSQQDCYMPAHCSGLTLEVYSAFQCSLCISPTFRSNWTS